MPRFAAGEIVVAHFPTGDPDFPRVAVACTVATPAYAPSGKVRIQSASGKVYTAAEDRLVRHPDPSAVA